MDSLEDDSSTKHRPKIVYFLIVILHKHKSNVYDGRLFVKIYVVIM